MSISKWFIILSIACLLQSCMQQRVSFSFNRHVDTAHFFKNILQEAQKFYPDTRISSISEVKMYIATYKETYIEDNHLLEWSELHDSSRIAKAHYLDVKGNATRLFLCLVSTQPEDVQAAIFFSAKYDAEGACLGFGPAYFGIVNPRQHTIAFTTELTVQQVNENFVLVVNKKQNRKAGVLFLSSQINNRDLSTNASIKIEKIILLDPNKIGGFKPVSFSIKDVLQDEHAMLFRFLKTIRF